MITQVVRPTTERMGPLVIRRVLPSRHRQMVGPFIFMDRRGPTAVPTRLTSHERPRAGMSTLSYLLKGSLLHRDSAGNDVKVFPGDVALMTAGRGMSHEELLGAEPPTEIPTLYSVKTWLALPDEDEDGAPELELHRKSSLPIVNLPGGRIRVLMGTVWSQTAPTTCRVETVLADVEVFSGGSVAIASESQERALYLLEGDAWIEDRPLAKDRLAVLRQGGEPCLTSYSGCRAILLGGKTFPSRRFIAEDFVASSPEKIDCWYEDYWSGKFPRIERSPC